MLLAFTGIDHSSSMLRALVRGAPKGCSFPFDSLKPPGFQLLVVLSVYSGISMIKNGSFFGFA
jgi:hypothetical protein